MWKRLFFTSGVRQPEPGRDAQWNRGAYLVAALGHCAECHTPRNLAGALKSDLYLAGSTDGPEGQAAPNITPHNKTGIGIWSQADLTWYLETGSDPAGDSAERPPVHGFNETAQHRVAHRCFEPRESLGREDLRVGQAFDRDDAIAGHQHEAVAGV